MALHGPAERFGEDGDPVLRALPVPDDDEAAPDVEVLDPEPEALPEPEAAPVEEARHEPVRPVEFGEDPLDLPQGQDDGEPPGPPGAGERGDLA